MKKLNSLPALLAILFSLMGFQQTPIKIPYVEAIKHVGEDAIVTGKVDHVLFAKSGSIFLDFGGEYPYNDFTGLILKADVKKFKDAKKFLNKEVEISGKIIESNSMPEIIITEPGQIIMVKDKQE